MNQEIAQQLLDSGTADYRDQIADILDTLPDEASIPYTSCCMGSVVYGPARCTCWVYEYDQEQQPATGVDAPEITKCCNDCAYRADSPERSATSNHACSAESPGELPDIPLNGLFFCHKGMRRKVAATHEPTGLRVEFSLDYYAGPSHNGRPLLANGDYARLCAGFSATHPGKRLVKHGVNFTSGY